MEDKFPEQWLPSYRGIVNFKTKLCIEMTTKTEQTKYWFKIKVDPQTSLSSYDYGDSDSNIRPSLNESNPPHAPLHSYPSTGVATCHNCTDYLASGD